MRDSLLLNNIIKSFVDENITSIKGVVDENIFHIQYNCDFRTLFCYTGYRSALIMFYA